MKSKKDNMTTTTIGRWLRQAFLVAGLAIGVLAGAISREWPNRANVRIAG
jgi:hypothetical protein